MIPDSEGLHEIANTRNAARKADIVFVHGLGGGSHSTWRYGEEGDSDHFFWPEEVGKKLPNCGVWTFGYAAGITSLGNPGMIIEKRAGNFASQMVLAGLGERPLVFITHSMGGLVVKSLIVATQLTADDARKRLVSNIVGIVFCGTPHRGSAFAFAAGVLGAFFGGSQAHVKEMAANAEPLDLLHDHFLAWHREHPVAIESYAESIGLFRNRWYRRPLPLGIVVPRASANPGAGLIRDVDADHLSLVKPSPAVPAIYNLVFHGVLKFVENALKLAEQRVPSVLAAPARDLVYLSYSSDDTHWHRGLRAVLDADPDLRDRIWDDTKLAKASNWQFEIPQHLERAAVLVIFASPAYFDRNRLASQWEMAPALQAERNTGLKIVWFKVSHCDYSPVRHIQSTLPVACPLDEMSEGELRAAFAGIHQVIRELVGLKRQPILPTSPPTVSQDAAPPHRPESSNISTNRTASSSNALALWRERLAFLEEAEAVAVDPAQKFKLKHDIAEAKAKIREHGGDT